MRRSAPFGAAFTVAWLATAGLGACSSDNVIHGGTDGGDASTSGGAATTSGGGGAPGSAGGRAGTSGTGGIGGTGARAGNGGRSGAPGGSPSGGQGGQSGSGGGCMYGGATHPVGSTFPSSDGCNTCTCSSSGAVGCTKRACIPDAGGDAASACTDTPAASFCVHGPTSTSAGEQLKVGDKLRITVQPRGCFSSSCTEVRTATCSAKGTTSLVVEAHFCLATTAAPGVGCTADCGGGGYAVCEPTGTLTAGQHTVKLGAFTVTFTVPGLLPVGGECIGSPF